MQVAEEMIEQFLRDKSLALSMVLTAHRILYFPGKLLCMPFEVTVGLRSSFSFCLSLYLVYYKDSLFHICICFHILCMNMNWNKAVHLSSTDISTAFYQAHPYTIFLPGPACWTCFHRSGMTFSYQSSRGCCN